MSVKRYEWVRSGMRPVDDSSAPRNRDEAFVLASDYELLEKRMAELEKDAARYRWLRDEDVVTLPRYYPFWEAALPKLVREERLDALIDKWMAMDFCEHEKDAATCGECHGQFGVGA